MIFLDTHLVVWLFEGRKDFLTHQLQALLEKNELYISPMVEMELELLFEMGRITHNGSSIVRELESRLGLIVSQSNFYNVVKEAQKLTWTRDPFDRLIVANAAMFNSSLLTKDQRIHKHYSKAVWK